MTLEAADTSKRAAVERDWKPALDKFYGEATGNVFVTHPKDAACDIPDRARPELAKMQLYLRGLLERGFQLDEGSFASFCDALGKRKQWPMDLAPRARMASTRTVDVTKTIDHAADRQKLPEKTRAWYHAMYAGMLRHADRLVVCQRRYPDPRVLFATLSGQEPKGRVETLYGPHAVHVRCERRDDFVKLWPNGNQLEEDDRKSVEGCLGYCTWKTLPAPLSGPVIVSVENKSRQAGRNDGFGTLLHELEHANNYFARHPSTFVDPLEGVDCAERCAAWSLRTDLKEEFIAWSLRRKYSFEDLFTGKNPAYDFPKKRAKELRKINVGTTLVTEFERAAANGLQQNVRHGEAAISALIARYGDSCAREILRTVPFGKWPAVAKALST